MQRTRQNINAKVFIIKAKKLNAILICKKLTTTTKKNIYNINPKKSRHFIKEERHMLSGNLEIIAAYIIYIAVIFT